MGKTILKVENLKTYFYSKEETVKAVDGVSFEVYEGETFGLVGESGCGKSATCRSILQLIKSQGKIIGGNIIYKDINLLNLNKSEMSKIRGREISMIFQEPMTSLNPILKIKKQIFDGFYKEMKLTNKEKELRALELLKLVKIPSPIQRLEEYSHQFSGGMRQRAMIAISLAAKPKLLLADEPTTALDVTIQDQIIKLINGLKKELKMSVILVTHDLAVIAQMCDRVAVMYAGKIVEMSDIKSIFSKPRHPYTYALMNALPSKNKRKKLEPIEGTPPNLACLPNGCSFAPRCKIAEKICLEKEPELYELEPGHVIRCHMLHKTSAYKSIIESSNER